MRFVLNTKVADDLKGIECDIWENAERTDGDCLAEAEWVLASVHYGQRQPREQITERLLAAIENPHVDCIAHRQVD